MTTILEQWNWTGPIAVPDDAARAALVALPATGLFDRSRGGPVLGPTAATPLLTVFGIYQQEPADVARALAPLARRHPSMRGQLQAGRGHYFADQTVTITVREGVVRLDGRVVKVA